MNNLFNNPLVTIAALIFAIVMIVLVILRFDRVKSFFKQFILVEDFANFPEGILEHGAALELLQREINKSERYNFPVSIILLEIKKSAAQKNVEFFEALQIVVKRSIRETDMFGFFESEVTNDKNQYICILPHTKFKEAYDLSERFRLKLAQRLSLNDDVDVNLFDLDKTDLNVQEFASLTNSSEIDLEDKTNISCGITELEYYEGIELFITRAVTALNMAKAKGGNCTMPQPVIKEVAITDIAKHLN